MLGDVQIHCCTVAQDVPGIREFRLGFFNSLSLVADNSSHTAF